MKTNNPLFWVVLALFAMSMNQAYALKNPYAVYCEAMGYEYATIETAEGTEGFCRLAGSVECPSFDYFMGKCGTDYNYCSKQGYGQKPGKGPECDADNQYAECLLCILPDGSAQEVTSLMNLDFREGVCGDGVCVFGEDYKRCPQDCPSGSADGFCDAARDGRCDTDCMAGEDPDCATETTPTATSTTAEPMAATSTQTAPEPTEESTTTTMPKEAGGKTPDVMGLLPYAVMALIIAAAAIAVYKKSKDKDIEKKREDFLRWKEEQEKLKRP